MTEKEWLLTQSKEVQEEFENMEKSQRKADYKELPVSQIYYGEKPISKNAMEAIKYTLDTLTERQKEVYKLCHIDGLTQAEAGKRLDLSQQVVAKHIKCIRKKITGILIKND
jgi:RNA polymerase sigma factor (sigma-70 family)